MPVVPVVPVVFRVALCIYSLRARSTPSTPYTFSGAFLVFAILKLHGMLNLSSCGNAYTHSVRSVCAVLTVSTADCYRQIISAQAVVISVVRPHDRTVVGLCGRAVGF